MAPKPTKKITKFKTAKKPVAKITASIVKKPATPIKKVVKQVMADAAVPETPETETEQVETASAEVPAMEVSHDEAPAAVSESAETTSETQEVEETTESNSDSHDSSEKTDDKELAETSSSESSEKAEVTVSNEVGADDTGSESPEKNTDKTKSQPSEVIEFNEEHRSKGIILWMFAIFLLIVVLMIVGYVAYRFGFQQGFTSATHPTASSSTTSTKTTATPTPQPTTASADISAYTVSVLNGSGIAGEAARVKTILAGKGFTVSTVGNADNPIQKTLIQSKSSVPTSVINSLKTLLSSSYTMDTPQTSSSISTDIVVTIGSQKANQ